MTQQDKDILLEKMLDPGSVLTDAEISLILSDEELREIYDVSSALRGACVQPSVVDVEQEWRLFRHKILPKPSRWRWVMLVAAIFLGVLVVSAIVKVVVDSILTPEPSLYSILNTPYTTPDTAKPILPKADTAELILPKADTAEPILPKADTAEPILAKANTAKPILPKADTAKPKLPKANGAKPEDIDVDEYLRLQQARIDNDLALLQAQLFIDEVQALREAELPSDDAEISYGEEIRYVIMQ